MRTVAFAGFVSVIALAVWSAPSPARQPAMWEVSGDSFVVRDEDARELWRVAFAEGLAEWAYSGPQSVPQFVDFEGDGSIETLFPQWSPNQAEVAGLICFTETGEERWRFVPGREVSTGTEPFENIFHIASFLPLDLPNGEKGVVAVSLHFPQYPTQVVVLSAETGRILAEYWHSGHVGTKADQLGVYDLDGDGVSEIYLVGISNSYRQATLVVLDPRTMEGASAEESAEYQLQGFARGQEVFRMLFPRSSMSTINDPYNSAINLWATPNQVVVSVLEDLTDATGPVILYHLRPDFSLEKITRTSSFDGVHERLLHEGLVETTLPKEEQALLRNVRVLTAPGVRDSSR